MTGEDRGRLRTDTARGRRNSAIFAAPKRTTGGWESAGGETVVLDAVRFLICCGLVFQLVGHVITNRRDSVGDKVWVCAVSCGSELKAGAGDSLE